MKRGKKAIRDGRTSDLTFSWLLTSQGSEYQHWQKHASDWMSQQSTSISAKLRALIWFFSKYIPDYAAYAVDITKFFKGQAGHLCSSEEMVQGMRSTGVNSTTNLATYPNYCHDFIEFVIDKSFSEVDDRGVKLPLVRNPISKVKKTGNDNLETVRQPLPYKYICELRQILCPMPTKIELEKIKSELSADDTILPAWNYRHFQHWVWAQQSKFDGDWFRVPQKLIDTLDPDCVWRSKKKKIGEEEKVIYEIWSPVRAMVVFLKLHLPLRTYQVRMLDSGEADTWRYECGRWKTNDKHSFSIGSAKRPFGKGVFKRIFDPVTGLHSTGLYINTNKTADQNKTEMERGYTIPWQHEEALYWLEKLRDWQEKYNPITEPTDCTSLKPKHLGQTKTHEQLMEMGECCFLFRDASARRVDRDKPIQNGPLGKFWYNLLLELENSLYESGQTVGLGDRLKLVVDYPDDYNPHLRTSTLFPLHSLRVSLITAYTMDTQLPLPVISKLLAGHSRLLMTIYYTKLTPAVMDDKMREAEDQLIESEHQSVLNFLKDASTSQIQSKMAYHDQDTIQSVLANRNPIGWEERAYGLCLVGGNTVNSDEVTTLGGCWNGGKVIGSRGGAGLIYSAVPHGPENCIRCRWFVTEANYLPALNAQFNQLSYKAHQAANLSVEIEGELESLKDEQFFCEEQGKPFTKHNELQALQRRYEKQQVEADEYAKDWIACFELINKIIRVEESRHDNDTRDKLIAVGAEQDVSYALKFMETESELLHLSLLCEDAEIYPDLQDELRKTPAIEKRSRQLSRALMKKGFEPIFMEMDDKQQLIAANAMLRQMAKIADPDDKLEGYRKVANYIEAGEYLEENKLFDAGINALTDKALHLENLAQSALLEG